MSTPTIPKAHRVTEHVDALAETHPLPWTADPDGVVDALGTEVSTMGIEEPLAAAVNAYADLPELLAERARLLVRVSDLESSYRRADLTADELRAAIMRALGITEHGGDLDLIARLTAAVHGLEGIDG